MDIVFGYFETLGFLERMKIVDIDLIYEIFGYYALKLWKPMRGGEYLKLCRKNKEEDQDVYDNFEYLAKKLEKYRSRKFQKTKFKN